MDKKNEWLIILNSRKKDDENQPANVSENLEQQIEIFLKEKLRNCEFVTQFHNNEKSTVVFKVSSNARPDHKGLALKPICIGNEIWEISVREISEFREDKIYQHLNDLYDHFEKNVNTFDYLSFTNMCCKITKVSHFLYFIGELV